jgi:hypothetical protein
VKRKEKEKRKKNRKEEERQGGQYLPDCVSDCFYNVS